MNAIIQGVVAFVAMFALDFVWVYYTKSVQAGRPVAAGGWAAGITVLNGAVAILYVGDPWTIIPAALGAAVGTLFAMRRGHAATQA